MGFSAFGSDSRELGARVFYGRSRDGRGAMRKKSVEIGRQNYMNGEWQQLKENGKKMQKKE